MIASQTAKQRRSARRRGGVAPVGAKTPAETFDSDLAAGRVQPHHRDARRDRETRVCCSAPWAEDHWHGDLHFGIDKAWHTPVEYPPGNGSTKMRLCENCGRYTPPQCFVTHRWHRLCQDCATLSHGTIAPIGRGASFSRLVSLGLSQKEIAAISWGHDGYSVRKIGVMMHLSKTQVARIIAAAKQKLAGHGLRAERLASEPPRLVLTDPAILDRFPAKD